MSGLNKMMRSSDIKGDTNYDIILRAWLDDKLEQIPADLGKMLERWEKVADLFKNGELLKMVNEDQSVTEKKIRHNFSTIVKYLRKEYRISSRTAYEDIRNAKRFFLCCQGREEIEFARGIAIEHGEQMMHEARLAGDLDIAHQFYKELNKIKGLHESHVEVPDYAEFVPPTFVLVSDPTELGFEKIENLDEVVRRIANEKRNGFVESEAEDAEVEPDE